MNSDAMWLQTGPDGATPLQPDDLESLIPGWVTTRAELNLVERDNIAKARRHPICVRFPMSAILDDHTIRALHKAMFGDVWSWAGHYRTTELSIGVAPSRVAVEVRNLVDEARFWLETTNCVDSAVPLCRIHHRLVQIHPFRNGNGRLARQYTDALVRATGTAPFTWGSGSGMDPDIRQRYITALRHADRGEFSDLIRFVRS